jgi:putative salt-induced outer membrane protein
MIALRKILPLAALVAVPAFAQAAPIPKPVADMIRGAVENEEPSAANAVVRLAKKSNPRSAAEIDALFSRLKARADVRRRMKLRRQRFAQGWKSRIEFGATNTTGTISSTGVTGSVSLVKDGLRWKNSFTSSVDYLRNNGVEQRNRYFVGHQANYKFNDRLYALGLASWEGNRAQGFRSRAIASAGFGYSLINAPKMSLSVEASPALRETDYGGGGRGSQFAIRVASNYQWIVTPKITLTEDGAFFREGRDQTLTSESALTMKLIDALSARVSYRLQREAKSRPLARSTDTTSRISLVYAF